MRQKEPAWIPKPPEGFLDTSWGVGCNLEKGKMGFVAQREVIKRCLAKRNLFVPVATWEVNNLSKDT